MKYLTVELFNCKEAEQMEDQLQASKANTAVYLSEVLKSARNLSGHKEPTDLQDPVFSGRVMFW